MVFLMLYKHIHSEPNKYQIMQNMLTDIFVYNIWDYFSNDLLWTDLF